MSDIDTNHVGVLLEQIASQNQAVLEAVGDMQLKVALLPTMQQDIAELKQDIKTIKPAVTATNRDVVGHEHRISRLEAA